MVTVLQLRRGIHLKVVRHGNICIACFRVTGKCKLKSYCRSAVSCREEGRHIKGPRDKDRFQTSGNTFMIRERWISAISCAVFAFPGMATSLPAQDGPGSPGPERSDAFQQPLSPEALEALVAGIALYPDPFVAQILDAAGHPAELHQAAQARKLTAKRRGGATQYLATQWPDSVKFLIGYPDALNELDRHRPLSTLLATAAQNRPDEVWTAIRAVRLKIEAAARQKSSGTETISPYVAAPAVIDRLYERASSRQNSTAPDSAPATKITLNGRYGRMNHQQIAQAGQIHAHAWESLNERIAASRAVQKNGGTGQQSNQNSSPPTQAAP